MAYVQNRARDDDETAGYGARATPTPGGAAPAGPANATTAKTQAAAKSRSTNTQDIVSRNIGAGSQAVVERAKRPILDQGAAGARSIDEAAQKYSGQVASTIAGIDRPDQGTVNSAIFEGKQDLRDRLTTGINETGLNKVPTYAAPNVTKQQAADYTKNGKIDTVVGRMGKGNYTAGMGALDNQLFGKAGGARQDLFNTIDRTNKGLDDQSAASVQAAARESEKVPEAYKSAAQQIRDMLGNTEGLIFSGLDEKAKGRQAQFDQEYQAAEQKKRAELDAKRQAGRGQLGEVPNYSVLREYDEIAAPAPRPDQLIDPGAIVEGPVGGSNGFMRPGPGSGRGNPFDQQVQGADELDLSGGDILSYGDGAPGEGGRVVEVQGPDGQTFTMKQSDWVRLNQQLEQSRAAREGALKGIDALDPSSYFTGQGGTGLTRNDVIGDEEAGWLNAIQGITGGTNGSRTNYANTESLLKGRQPIVDEGRFGSDLDQIIARGKGDMSSIVDAIQNASKQYEASKRTPEQKQGAVSNIANAASAATGAGGAFGGIQAGPNPAMMGAIQNATAPNSAFGGVPARPQSQAIGALGGALGSFSQPTPMSAMEKQLRAAGFNGVTLSMMLKAAGVK